MSDSLASNCCKQAIAFIDPTLGFSNEIEAIAQIQIRLRRL
jgi:hypothetical protein